MNFGAARSPLLGIWIFAIAMFLMGMDTGIDAGTGAGAGLALVNCNSFGVVLSGGCGKGNNELIVESVEGVPAM